ncbi:MAG: beta-ketoacyl-[acyl-carrier-protein] synthase II, partial [Gemmataceae bacterium]|nr:beta-ketoacyl-[acyl-carrier-protein] synthase II [Gemmataceae bacterium]
MRRVVITGMGAVTPLGEGVGATFEGLLAGRSGVGPITRFDARAFPTTFAAEVKGFDLGRHLPDAAPWKGMRIAGQCALAAGRMALGQAGLLEGGPRERFGVYLGTGEGKQDFHNLLRLTGRSHDPASPDHLDHVRLARHGSELYVRENEYEQELHTPSAALALAFGLEGPNFACLTACAAGTQALGEAAQLVRHGDADLMLAGGAHSMVYELGLTGFTLLTALSKRNADPQRASRPFDAGRDGFVLGEGAGLLVLEELEHARR